MTRRLGFDVLLLSLLAEAVRWTSGSSSTSEYNCPRSLYDCDSLEEGLRATANNLISPEFMVSRHDDHYMAEICRFMKTPECSDGIIRECKGELRYATKAFKSKIQVICGEARFTRKDSMKLQNCFRDNHQFMAVCQEKRKDKEKEVEVPYLAHQGTNSAWCNVTNDYRVCIYSVMAMGCDIDLAENYMETLNSTAAVVEAILTHGCSFGHPLDILRTTSPFPDTTSYSGLGGFTSRRRPSSGSQRSGAAVSFLSSASSGAGLCWGTLVKVLGVWLFHDILLKNCLLKDFVMFSMRRTPSNVYFLT